MRDLTTRVGRLKIARDKTQNQLNDTSFLENFSSRHGRLRKKLRGIERSLANIERYGQETAPDERPTGVSIAVPHAGGPS